MVVRFFKGYALLEVTRQREVATDLTFLTGLKTFATSVSKLSHFRTQWTRSTLTSWKWMVTKALR
jgi:hypothetical protein